MLSVTKFKRDMRRDSIRLDIDDRLHCDLIAKRFVTRGTGIIRWDRQYRSCVFDAFPATIFGLFLQPR